jgi:DNA-binding transcriptional LysR family regulator
MNYFDLNLQQLQTFVTVARLGSFTRAARLLHPSISSTILPTAVARFKGNYPGISVVLKDVIAQRLVTMVKAEEVDFGIGSLNVADP